jgi:hypothetical protein
MGFIKDALGGGINSNSIKSPFGINGVGNIGLSFGENGPSLSANFNRLLKKAIDPSKVSGELSSLYSSPVEESIVFPKDLTDEHYMLIKVMNRTRASADNADQKRVWQTIVLPVPSNLKTDYSLNYEQASLGILGGKAAGRGSLTEGSQDIGALLANKIGNIGSEVGLGTSTDGSKRGASDMVDTATAIAGVAGAALLGKKLGGGMLGAAIGAGAVGADQVGTAVMMKQGVAVNPHLAQVFKGVGLRDFNFSWNLVARDEGESLIINKLINTLKKYSHPAYFAGSYGFDYPMEFEVEFSEHIAHNLFKINRSVLKGVNVDYGPQGIPLFFDNGMPVQVNLGLQFQETQIMTAEDFGGHPRTAGSSVDGEFEASKPGSRDAKFISING